jgi:NADPH:quinone reductase-like Zn-dependent oxidoreductase
MLAAVAVSQSANDPLSGLELRGVPVPEVRPGWALVRVVASSLNMHDLWTLRGVGHAPEDLPRILGCDAAGYDAGGNPVVVYPVIASSDRGNGDETLDPQRALLSEKHDGAFAEWLLVPDETWSPSRRACPSMRRPASRWPGVRPTGCCSHRPRSRRATGFSCRVPGGGVASAAIKLAGACRSGRVRHLTIGEQARTRRVVGRPGCRVGGRLPERVDVVVETVGEATWSHSLKSLRPGGTVVIAGATSGMNPPADLGRVFYLQQRILGSTGCTRSELVAMLRMLEATGVRPVIDRACHSTRSTRASS